jgi:TonB family protein
MIQRRKRNSSKINLTISFVVHGILIFVIFFFAAREGMLGKKLKEITVTMVPKEKKPEAPKEKPPENKPEQPKEVEAPKNLAVPPPQLATAPPPSTDNSAPAVAPSAVSLPSFEFSDGAHDVQSISDPNGIYKGLVEYTLRSRWNRPENIADDKYAAEVEVVVAKDGTVDETRWLKGSGDKRWDDSVKAALAQTKSISRPPPKGFPSKFTVRFDVASMATEDVMELSSR